MRSKVLKFCYKKDEKFKVFCWNFEKLLPPSTQGIQFSIFDGVFFHSSPSQPLTHMDQNWHFLEKLMLYLWIKTTSIQKRKITIMITNRAHNHCTIMADFIAKKILIHVVKSVLFGFCRKELAFIYRMANSFYNLPDRTGYTLDHFVMLYPIVFAWQSR